MKCTNIHIGYNYDNWLVSAIRAKDFGQNITLRNLNSDYNTRVIGSDNPLYAVSVCNQKSTYHALYSKHATSLGDNSA